MGERAALAAAMDALADAVEAAQSSLKAASPATRALIDEHESWPANFIWTDGTNTARAARRLAALLRRYPASTDVARDGAQRGGAPRSDE